MSIEAPEEKKNNIVNRGGGKRIGPARYCDGAGIEFRKITIVEDQHFSPYKEAKAPRLLRESVEKKEPIGQVLSPRTTEELHHKSKPLVRHDVPYRLRVPQKQGICTEISAAELIPNKLWGDAIFEQN